LWAPLKAPLRSISPTPKSSHDPRATATCFCFCCCSGRGMRMRGRGTGGGSGRLTLVPISFAEKPETPPPPYTVCTSCLRTLQPPVLQTIDCSLFRKTPAPGPGPAAGAPSQADTASGPTVPTSAEPEPSREPPAGILSTRPVLGSWTNRAGSPRVGGRCCCTQLHGARMVGCPPWGSQTRSYLCPVLHLLALPYLVATPPTLTPLSPSPRSQGSRRAPPTWTRTPSSATCSASWQRASARSTSASARPCSTRRAARGTGPSAPRVLAGAAAHTGRGAAAAAVAGAQSVAHGQTFPFAVHLICRLLWLQGESNATPPDSTPYPCFAGAPCQPQQGAASTPPAPAPRPVTQRTTGRGAVAAVERWFVCGRRPRPWRRPCDGSMPGCWIWRAA
jgi:hypothetical protein